MSSISSSTPRTSDHLETIAAEWIARRNGGLNAGEERELAAWLKADERNRLAFNKVSASWEIFAAAHRDGAGECLWQEIDADLIRRKRRGHVFWWSAGLAAAAVLAVGFFSLAPVSRSPTKLTSINVRPDQQTLPDGTVVELNAGAEISVAYTPEKRMVRLVRGEALFAVAKDAMHPFIVSAGNVDVRAVGTAFTVNRDAKQVDVLVTEGRVAVERINNPALVAESATMAATNAPVYLGVGSRVVIPVDQPLAVPVAVQPVSTEAIAQALSWREKRLEFVDTPLSEAIKLFNKENKVQLALGDSALNRRSITGIFWADDPNTFARLLEAGFDLKADRDGDDIVLYDTRKR